MSECIFELEFSKFNWKNYNYRYFLYCDWLQRLAHPDWMVDVIAIFEPHYWLIMKFKLPLGHDHS